MNENMLAPKKLFDDIVYVVETPQNYLVLDVINYNRQLSANEAIGLAKFMNCVNFATNGTGFDWPELIDNLGISSLFIKYTDITGLFDSSHVVVVRLNFANSQPIP